MALLITVFLLLVMSTVGLSAMNRARDDATMSGASRAKLQTLSLADAGMRMVEVNLLTQLNTTGVVGSVTLDDPNFSVDPHGYKTGMKTGTPGSSVASPIQRVGAGIAEGSQLNVGQGGTFTNTIFRASVVATDPSGGNAQVQAQFSVREGSAGY
jgi:hypothetical protein